MSSLLRSGFQKDPFVMSPEGTDTSLQLNLFDKEGDHTLMDIVYKKM